MRLQDHAERGHRIPAARWRPLAAAGPVAGGGRSIDRDAQVVGSGVRGVRAGVSEGRISVRTLSRRHPRAQRRAGKGGGRFGAAGPATRHGLERGQERLPRVAEVVASGHCPWRTQVGVRAGEQRVLARVGSTGETAEPRRWRGDGLPSRLGRVASGQRAEDAGRQRPCSGRVEDEVVHRVLEDRGALPGLPAVRRSNEQRRRQALHIGPDLADAGPNGKEVHGCHGKVVVGQRHVQRSP